MRIKFTIQHNLFVLVMLSILASCQKYTGLKTNEQFNTITKIEDLAGLLDNVSIMNETQPSTPEIVSDNFFIMPNDWDNLSSMTQKNTYIWDKDVYNDSKENDWFYIYRTVAYTNIVLENLDSFAKTAPREKFNEIKASALFFRAWSFFQALQIWAPAYDPSQAGNLMGIPLKTTSDFNVVNERSTLDKSYQLIIDNLQEAVQYLPEKVSYKTRPSKAAGYGLLSRIYLARQDYSQAGRYADLCLKLTSALLDFNDLNIASNAPVPKFNTEVIFHTTAASAIILNSPRGKVDTLLYTLYNENDLRKHLFFRPLSGYYTFKGSYDGSGRLFTGLATDEILLTKAEVLARSGKAEECVAVLNTLLEKRYRTGHFNPIKVPKDGKVLPIVLLERRKELLFRHLRWMDLKRLNREASTATKLSRNLNGQLLVLTPNENRYTFQIPKFIIQNSDIRQNP